MLHTHGVGTPRAVRISKTYGADAAQAMADSPYRLARDIRGTGFKTADAIAVKLGIETTAVRDASKIVLVQEYLSTHKPGVTL